jgi:hypothetical protein
MATVGQKLGFSGDVNNSGGVLYPVLDGLAAHAGGGQASAAPIALPASGTARFTTVATAGDSAILPSAPGGAYQPEVTVINAGAASMNVFPPVGSQINNAGANVAFAVAAGKTATFYSISGVWHAQLSA